MDTNALSLLQICWLLAWIFLHIFSIVIIFRNLNYDIFKLFQKLMVYKLDPIFWKYHQRLLKILNNYFDLTFLL